MLAGALFAACLAPVAAQKPLALGSPASSSVLRQSAPRKTAAPYRDPVDQPFRLAPMPEASRSLALALATNLHLAFDTERLRFHTAWAGPSLRLYGTPYRASKTPFLCQAGGTRLWGNPPWLPWSEEISPIDAAAASRLTGQFASLTLEAQGVLLRYSLTLPDGTEVSIEEKPRPRPSLSPNAIVRQMNLGPASRGLWLLLHAELGHQVEGATAPNTMVIQRQEDFLVVSCRSNEGVTFEAQSGLADYQYELLDEEKGESITRSLEVEGHQTRIYARIPAHAAPVGLDIFSVVCPNRDEVKEVLARIQREENAALFADEKQAAHASRATVFPPGASVTRRVDGDSFYEIEHFPLPEEIELQVTGLDWLPDGNLAVSTWKGEIYVVENAQGPVSEARYRRFARGLHEPLGLKVFAGDLYVAQKHELTRIRDVDQDGEADLFETINDDWGYSGNYHAFAFGPVLDAQNNFYVFLCGQRGSWEVPYVGWAVRIAPDGKELEGFCSGLRAPNGFGTFGPNRDIFIADNQGNWVGASKLNHLEAGKFYGFPSGRPAPQAEYESPQQFAPPAVWFPRKLSPSTSGLATIDDERFGPFQGQMLVGDFQNAVVLRVFLEQVEGVWQGAVWPFAKGFYSGVNRLAMGPDGKLYAGGLRNAAWAAVAPKDHSLDRVRFTGEVPFEVQTVRATARGFELAFTRPVEAGPAANPDNYDVSQFTYRYHEKYGSPEIDWDGREESASSIRVEGVEVSEDGRRVQLRLGERRAGYVTWFRLFDLTSREGESLRNEEFFYTLNQIPGPR